MTRDTGRARERSQWLGHNRIDETMLYVHVAEAHPRQPPKLVQKAACRIADPDARVLVMRGARGAESSSKATPNRCAVAKAWPKLRP